MNTHSDGAATGKQFEDLMSKVRRGDQDAARQLVKEYEPEVRRFLRYRLSTSRLRRIVDSLDLAQSVFGRFFVYLQGNENIPADAEQLRNFLLAAARNAFLDRVRKEHADRRDNRRMEYGAGVALEEVRDSAGSPSMVVANEELIMALRQRLTDEEQQLVDQWLDGRPWDELARQQGRSPDALRKQVSRAIDRAARDLGLLTADS